MAGPWDEYKPQAERPPGPWGDYAADAAPVEPRSALGEIGTAAKAGALIDLPHIAGQTAKYVGIKSGQKLVDYAAEQAARPDLQPQEEQHGPVTNFLAGGARMIPPVVGPIVAGALAPEGVLPAAGAMLIGAAPFALSAGQDTYEAAKAKGLSEDEATTTGRQAAAANAAAMSLLPAGVGGVARGAIGAGARALTPAAKSAAGAAEQVLTKPTVGGAFARGLPADLAANTAMGVGSAVAQTAVERGHGLTDKTLGESAEESLPHSAGAALLFGPLSYLHASKAAKGGSAHIDNITKSLANPAAPPAMRAGAIRTVYDAMAKADPEGANMWAINAEAARQQGKPIGLDSSWTESGHPSVFPEHTPPTEDVVGTFEGEGGGQPQGTPGEPQRRLPAPGQTSVPENGIIVPTEGTQPFDLTRQHGVQNAVDASAKLEADRQAYEAEQARLRASGPLGAAAAAGRDSGAVAGKAEERAAEVPQPEPPEQKKAANPEEEQVQLNIRSWTRRKQAVPLAEAQAAAAQLNAAETPVTVVPHPNGKGYTIVPDQLITPDFKEQHAGLQSRAQEMAPPSARTLDPDAARALADQRTAETGVEHEVVPHPFVRDKFLVQEKPLSTEREQTQGVNNAEGVRGDEGQIREGRPEGQPELQRGAVESGRDLQQPAEAGRAAGDRDSGRLQALTDQATRPEGGAREGVQQGGVEASPLYKAHGAANAIEAPTPEAPVREHVASLPTEIHDKVKKSLGGATAVQAPTPEQGHFIGGVMASLKKLGMPDSWLHGLESFYVSPGGSGAMRYHPKLGVIGWREGYFDAAKADQNIAKTAVHDAQHEVAHHVDSDGGDHFASSDARAKVMALKTDESGLRAPEGAVMREAFRAANTGPAELRRLLRYPFQYMDSTRPDSFIQEEVHAQLAGLFRTNPELMKKHFPVGHEVHKEIHDAGLAATNIDQARRGVREALWSRHADGSRAERGAVDGGQHGAAAERTRIRLARSGLGEQVEPAVRRSEAGKGDHVVNIGLNTNDGKGVTKEEVLKALEAAGVKVTAHEVKQSNTEPTLIARLDRALTADEAHALSATLRQEAIAQKSNGVGELYGPKAKDWGPFSDEFFIPMSDAAPLAVEHPTLDKRTKGATTEAEQARLLEGKAHHAAKRVEKYAKVFEELPSTAEVQHAALAGRAARGWYERSRKAGEAMYGKDYPRFAGLMAALSPQTDVETNFYNAAKVWSKWIDAGRPKDAAAISKILNSTLVTPEGQLADKTSMKAYLFNTVRTLRHETGDRQLSGPKVESFRQNLLGNLEEVTNDRHVAAFMGIMQNLFEGADAPALVERGVGVGKTFGVKDYGYIATSAKQREAAKALTKATGDPWKPAEVQETLWSFWKALYDLATNAKDPVTDERMNPEGKSAVELIRSGALTHEMIARVPDLGRYFDEDRYKAITGGKAQGLEGDAGKAARISAANRGAARETGPVASSAAIERIAKRLDRLIVDRAEAERVKAAKKAAKKAESELGDAQEGGPVEEAPMRDLPMGVEHAPENADRTAPFYSALSRAITEKAPFPKGDKPVDAQMLRNWLEARTKDGTVKRDEVQWTGLDDWLRLRGGDVKRVTRAEVEQFLAQNGVKVEEKMLGEPAHDAESWWNDEGGANEKTPFSDLTARERELAEMRYQEEVVEYQEDGTIYHEHQLPGGKNYRELLLTLPPRRGAAMSFEEWMDQHYPDADKPSPEFLRKTYEASRETGGMFRHEKFFQPPHFDEPNLLAHVRFNERTDANGKRVLFIEELQSDWAQKGRKLGFDNGEERSVPGWSEPNEDGGRMMELKSRGVPAAPFVGKTEAWVALAMKRMIRYAADNGFDRVAWTTGEQQAARYDLSKQVDRIRYQKDKDGTYYVHAEAVNGGDIVKQGLSKPEVADLVGKEIADKMERGEGAQGAGNRKLLSGIDLKVGGEGMKSFYDKIVPNVANDVLKKLGGGRVGDVPLNASEGEPIGWRRQDTGQETTNKAVAINWHNNRIETDVLYRDTKQSGFDITPAMKSKVVEGLPMFVEHTAEGDRAVPARSLMTKITGGKAGEAEQQFTKAGEPVSMKKDPHLPDWLKDAPAEARAFAQRAGMYVPKVSWKERWKEQKQNMGLKVVQGVFDQFSPVLKRVGEYPYKLLRMAASSDNGLAALMEHGSVNLNKWGALQVVKDSKSLRAILSPLAGEHDRFFGWMAAQRAQDLMKDGREHNFTPEQIEAGLKFNGKLNDKDNFKGEGSRQMAYAKAMKEFAAMNKSVLDVAEAAGVVDPEARKLYEREFYVNFRREKGGEPEFQPNNLAGMVNVKGVQRLKGGEEVLHDLIANTMTNWSSLLSSALRNNAAWQTLEHAEALGIARRVKAEEKGSVYVLQDGKQVHWAVDDPLVLDAISSLGAVPFRGPAMQALTKFKHILTTGVTLSPTFRINNVLRDQIAAVANNPTTYKFWTNMIEGFKYSSKNNPEYANMLAGGAIMKMGHGFDVNRGELAKRLIAEGIDKEFVLDSPTKVGRFLGHAWDWWQETGERSESITRAELYRQTFKKMIDSGHDPERAHFEASYIARDSMDFSLHGTWAAVRMVSQMVPFMNARLQGLYKMGRASKEDPKRFYGVMGAVTLATIALTLAYRDDKEMQERSEWDRDNFWAVKVGDKIVRFPKPFEIGAAASIVDRGLEAAMNGLGPDDRDRFVKRLGAIVGNQLNMNPIPQAASPLIQLWGNKSFFTGQQIETEREQNLSTSERIGPNTTATAQLLGKAGILSPQQIDFLVNAYLGWAGNHAVLTADFAMRPMMGLPSKPTPQVNDYFIIGDFVKQLPSNQSRFVEQYYDHLKEVQEAVADMRALQQSGQLQRAAEHAVEHRDEIALSRLYNHTSRQLGLINQRMRWTNMRTDASMSPDQKREELTRLTQLKNRLIETVETTRSGIAARQ